MPTLRTWPIRIAKARFAALVRSAEEDGPQVITRRGQRVVIVGRSRSRLDIKAAVSEVVFWTFFAQCRAFRALSVTVATSPADSASVRL
jgi:prevent-host-death family protein